MGLLSDKPTVGISSTYHDKRGDSYIPAPKFLLQVYKNKVINGHFAESLEIGHFFELSTTTFIDYVMTLCWNSETHTPLHWH